MPLGVFKLNSIAKLLDAGAPPPVETTYSPGWYNYTTDSGENNTSYVASHQIAIMGHNSDFSIRGVAAIQPQTDTNNYLLPFKWNYSTNAWTIGTKVVTQAAPTDYRGFTGRKAVSELYPTNAGTVDATTYGAHYIPGNISEQRLWIPFSVDASGAITNYTGLATGSPGIGTSAESGDLVYVSNASGNPLYAFFTREDSGNNTISTFTRSGNAFTKIPGINSFGTGNRATVESVVVDGGGAKACFVVFSQAGTMAAVRVAADNTYGISTSTAISFGGEVSAVHLSNSSSTVSKIALFGPSSDATQLNIQIVVVTWSATPTISVQGAIVLTTTAIVPDLGYYFNLRMVKGWADDEVMIFYIKSGVVYGRYGKLNTIGRLVFDAEQTFVSMSNARSLDVCPVYIDSNHRYFIGMINNSPGENQDGDMNLFAIRAQNITTPAQMYHIRTNLTSVNEGTNIQFNVDTLGVADGTTLFYTVETNAGDFATTSGSFNISGGGVGSFNVTPTADFTTEGAETFTVAVRTGSTSGTIVATSVPVTINDTSIASTTSMTYITNSNSLGTTITIPATATTGDIAVLWDMSLTTTNTVPSGWTQINTATTTAMRFTISYRKLGSGENGTTITGMTGTTRKVMAIFRGNVVPTTITPTVFGSQATTLTPSNQSMTAGGSAPYIYFSGHAVNSSGGSRSWSAGSPTEIIAQSATSVYGRFQIYNSGGAPTTTVSMTDGGTNAMISFRMNFS
jgi:hypothetical protein